jgi:hypothetical protein
MCRMCCDAIFGNQIFISIIALFRKEITKVFNSLNFSLFEIINSDDKFISFESFIIDCLSAVLQWSFNP